MQHYGNLLGLPLCGASDGDVVLDVDRVACHSCVARLSKSVAYAVGVPQDPEKVIHIPVNRHVNSRLTGDYWSGQHSYCGKLTSPTARYRGAASFCRECVAISKEQLAAELESD